MGYFCTSKSNTKTSLIDNENTSIIPIQIKIENKIIDNDQWDTLGKQNIYLSSQFLNVINNNPPSDLVGRFVEFYKKEVLIGIAYFQIKDLNLAKSMRLDSQSKPKRNLFSGLKNIILKRINQKILILGNLLVTGDNAFIFDKSISEEESQKLLNQAVDKCLKMERSSNSKINTVLAKDFFVDESKRKIQFSQSCYTDFKVQPNMIFHLDPTWKNIEGYLASMKAKHRKRAKRAFKKGVNLEFRLLNAEEIRNYRDKIYDLYKQTSDSAGFNLFVLNPQYFQSLILNTNDDFQMHGVFNEEKMVAFYTTIMHNGSCDAHFLGYDKKENSTSQLYLNILFKLVEKAIYFQSNELNLSRTAMEIKSSIGAESYDMTLHLKSENRILNFFINKFLLYFIPIEEWVPRSPFK